MSFHSHLEEVDRFSSKFSTPVVPEDYMNDPVLLPNIDGALVQLICSLLKACFFACHLEQILPADVGQSSLKAT